MFVTKQSDSLRQGDIIDKLFFTPPSFYALKDEKISLQPNLVLRETYLVIVSQCCDLQWDPDQKGHLRPRRPYVLVAPLSFKMPFTKGTEEYQKLVENGKNQPEKDPIQYFYYGENPAIGAESVVDFSTIMPIRSSILRDSGAEKLLELDIRHRHLFRTRLREYFSRIPDEDWEEVVTLFPGDFT